MAQGPTADPATRDLVVALSPCQDGPGSHFTQVCPARLRARFDNMPDSVNCILDTGSSISLIHRELASAAGCQPLPFRRVSINGLADKSSTDGLVTAEIILTETDGRPLRLRIPMHLVPSGPGLLLGNDVLNELGCTVDLTQQTASFQGKGGRRHTIQVTTDLRRNDRLRLWSQTTTSYSHQGRSRG